MTSRRAPSQELERRGVLTLEPATTADIVAMVDAIPRAPGSIEPEHERAARLAHEAERARLLTLNWAAGDPIGWGLGLTAWRDVTRVGVPVDLHRDRVPGAGSPTECYPMAMSYLLDHHDHDVVLVHGLVQERGRLWPHAWTVIAGHVVYDSTTGEHYDRDSYYEVLRPVVVGAYSPGQAAAMAITEGNAGPWGTYSKGRPGHVLALEAVLELSDDYQRTYPAMFEWVQAMKQRDARFARDLAAMVSSDALAIGDLLASLVERPDLWRSHSPGTPWGYRLRKHPDHARVIYPEIT